MFLAIAYRIQPVSNGEMMDSVVTIFRNSVISTPSRLS
jgi:hypothetical protein